MSASATSVYDMLLSFVEGEKWKSEPLPDQGAVSYVFDGNNGPWRTYAKAFEQDRQIAFYGVLPFTIEEDRRAAAAELITRINFGVVIGNFEMDFDDGEVRFKTSLDFEGEEPLSTTLILHLARANLSVMDHYIPAFVALTAGDKSPAGALAEVAAA